MRRFTSIIAIGTALVLATSVVFAASDGVVRTTGDERVVPNAMVQATLKFAPGQSNVSSGDQLAWVHDDKTTAPHTVTIVEEFPDATLEGIFECQAPGEPCALALAGHFGGGLNPVVEAGGPGLDAAGDSRLLFPGGSATATVSAPAGTTLKYLCAIHPWMQGEIVVR